MAENPLEIGLYERLLDEELAALLASHTELRPTFEKLDDESAPVAKICLTIRCPKTLLIQPRGATCRFC